jgi:hypothetical protein
MWVAGSTAGGPCWEPKRQMWWKGRRHRPEIVKAQNEDSVASEFCIMLESEPSSNVRPCLFFLIFASLYSYSLYMALRNATENYLSVALYLDSFKNLWSLK